MENATPELTVSHSAPFADASTLGYADGMQANLTPDAAQHPQEHAPGRLMKVVGSIFPVTRLAERPAGASEVFEHAARERRKAVQRMEGTPGVDSTDLSYAAGFLPRPY